MPTITIEIPKKVLQNGGTRRLLAVDPKEFERELRRRREVDDAKEASRMARVEQKSGKARLVRDLKVLMK